MIIAHHACHQQEASEQQLTVQIMSGSADAHEISGAVTLGAEYTTMYGGKMSAHRFENITIPYAAIITSAFFKVWKYGVISGWDVKAELAINAAELMESTANLSARVRGVAVDFGNPTTDNSAITVSADISAVIQQVVTQSGWQSGNPIVIFFVATASASIFTEIFFEIEQSQSAAVLEINWR